MKTGLKRLSLGIVARGQDKKKMTLKELAHRFNLVMSIRYKSYAITVRPRAGLKTAHEDVLLAWLQSLPHCVAVHEREGEAMHLHAQIWSMEGWIKGNIVKKLRKIGERCLDDWDAPQAKVQSQGVRIAYSDWATDYLINNDDKPADEQGVVLIENAPDVQEAYYPSQDEQDAVQTRVNAKDSLMHSWAELWEEHASDDEKTRLSRLNRLLYVGRFCSRIWFQLKLRPTLRNDRDQKDFVKRLTAYLIGFCPDSELLSAKDLEFCEAIEFDLQAMDNG